MYEKLVTNYSGEKHNNNNNNKTWVFKFSGDLPVSVENTRKELSQKPAAMRKRESTVVTKQLVRARTRCEKLSPSCRRASAAPPPCAAGRPTLFKTTWK